MVTLEAAEVQIAIIEYIRKRKLPRVFVPSLQLLADGSAVIMEACHNDTGPDIGGHVSVTARCDLFEGHTGDHLYRYPDGCVIRWPE